MIKYHIEIWNTTDGWMRLISDLTDYYVAKNMVRQLAKQAGLDRENYSILVEVKG